MHLKKVASSFVLGIFTLINSAIFYANFTELMVVVARADKEKIIDCCLS